MNTPLDRFTPWAQEAPLALYNALMGLLSDPDGLTHSFEVQPGNKAAGIDKVSKSDYAQDLEERITALSGELRSLSYTLHGHKCAFIFREKLHNKQPLSRNKFGSL